MTQASPLLAYLQAMQQGRQQNEQMRQQFGLQNLEQQKNNAQFLMELADKKEAREQQRKQFQWQQNEENRRTLAEGQAVADRVRALQEAADKRNADIANYIGTKTNPLQTAYHNVLSLRKQVEELGKNGQRFSPTQIKLLQQELAKAEGNHAAALQTFGNTITGDTTYGIDWDKVQQKYALPAWQLPSAFARRSIVAPGGTNSVLPATTAAPALTGNGPVNVIPQTGISDEEKETGKQILTPQNVGLGSPVNITGNFIGAGYDPLNTSGLVGVPSPFAKPVTPPKKAIKGTGNIPSTAQYAGLAAPMPEKVAEQAVEQLESPQSRLAALASREGKRIQGGEWQTHELEPEVGKTIVELAKDYVASRGKTFRPKKFQDTIYGGNIDEILNGYQRHVSNEDALNSFLDTHLFGDLSEYRPNVIRAVASMISDKGYVDPDVLSRLAKEAADARTERIREQGLNESNYKFEELKANRPTRDAEAVANLKYAKKRAEAPIHAPTAEKTPDYWLKKSRIISAWNKSAGAFDVIDGVIKRITSDKGKLGTSKLNASEKLAKEKEYNSALKALESYKSDVALGGGYSQYLDAAEKNDFPTVNTLLAGAGTKWKKVLKANPILNSYYADEDKRVTSNMSVQGTPGDVE